MLIEMEGNTDSDEDVLVKQDRIIGSLMKHVQLFKLYQPYLQNFQNSLKVLQGLAERELKAFFSSAAENEKCSGYNLESLLIMPVQRVPRYRLLLQELKKQYKDPDKNKEIIKQIDDALVIVCELAKKCNDSVENMSERVKLMEIYERFDNDPRVTNKASRKFIDIIDVKEVTRRSSEAITLILFSDVFLLAKVINDKVTPTKLKYRYSYDLKHTTLKDIPETFLQNTFSLYTPTKCFFIQCKDAQKKRGMTKQINDAIKKRITYSFEVEDKVNIIMNPNCMNSVCENRGVSRLDIESRKICVLCGKIICPKCAKEHEIFNINNDDRKRESESSKKEPENKKPEKKFVTICGDCNKISKNDNLNISNPVLLVDSEKLPNCWKLESTSNKTYYVNSITKQMSLLHPQAALYLDRLYSAEIVPCGWRRCYTEKGDKFYYNLYTNKTQWQLPTENAVPNKETK